MKLLIRGGSISAGFGVDLSYVDILEGFCRPLNIEFINRSRFQDNSFDGPWTFYEDIENAFA